MNGKLTIPGGLQIDGELTVNGKTEIGGDVNIIGKSTLNNDTTFGKNILVNGVSTVNGNSNVGGSTSIGGNSTVNGTSTVNKDLTIAGSINGSGNLKINGDSLLNNAFSTKYQKMDADILFDMMNTQVGFTERNCECSWFGADKVIFNIPFRKKIPIVYIAMTGYQTGSGNWGAYYPVVDQKNVTLTGFTFSGWSHANGKFYYIAVCSNTDLQIHTNSQ